MYRWVVKVKHLLEARGVRFPVPDPGLALRARLRAENAQRRQWETTAAGQPLVRPIKAAEQALALGRPTEDYNATMRRRTQAERAFQAWRKTQPGWFPSPTDDDVRLYPSPLPTPADELADEPTKAEIQADSARWAEQARAIH